MHGNNFEKLFRLAKNLTLNPQGILRYVKYSKSRPLDIETPWFSWKSIEFLDEFLQPNFKVFEYGSGGSTAFFSKRVASVTSVEDNAEWITIVGEAAATRGLKNVQIIHADLKNSDGAFEASPYVLSLKSTYDVIVVDGSEDWPTETLRPVCFRHAESHVAPGGIIVVDDAWRYDQFITTHSAKEKREFLDVGPGRYGVTRTDVYFY